MQEESKILGFYKQYRKNKSALVGLYIVIILIFAGLLAPILAPHDPIIQNLGNRLIPPFWNAGGSFSYILGTDDFGRDVLSRIMYGARISLMIGIISVSIALVFGTLVGSISAYFGGLIDMIFMRIMDIMLAIPSILLAVIIVSVLGPSLFNVMIAIGIVGIPSYARLIRGSVLAEKEKEYVTASRINGSSHFRLILKVILPNCAAPLIVTATMGFATAVIEAAAYSFLGLGAQPPTPEWGAMLTNSLEFITTAPWMVFYPGIAIFLTVMGFNLVGDGLMDVLDPKLKDR